MDEEHIVDPSRAGSQDVAINEESTRKRQNAALERQNAALQRQNAALLEDNEDLRASALWWKALYEESQRRQTDMESSPKARVGSRLDVRFPRPSSTPRTLYSSKPRG